MAKYIVNYCSGPTGYGWRQEYDRLEDFESFVNTVGFDYSTALDVWDETQQKFIFWKDVLTSQPRIDDLHRVDRDYRTKSRSRK